MILITGSAGFIGYSLTEKLLKLGEDILGIDNHNDYYDPEIKKARVSRLTNYKTYKHLQIDLSDTQRIGEIFTKYKIIYVVNLGCPSRSALFNAKSSRLYK